MKKLRQSFLTGLVVLVPFLITAYVIVTAFSIMDGWIRRFHVNIPGAGMLIVLVITITVGWAVKRYTGMRIQKFAEYLITKVSPVNMIYSTAKEVCQTIFNRDKNAFQYVALVDFGGQKTLGFVVGEAPTSVLPRMVSPLLSTDKVLSVYVMQAFSPAAGFVLLLPESLVRKVDMSVEDGLKFVLTGGMVKRDALPVDDGSGCAAIGPVDPSVPKSTLVEWDATPLRR